jgi:cysteinyl-tRNA synthetase
MISIIKALLQKGIAYKGNDNCIYFSIAKFPEYGKLSKIQFDELKAGARVSQDEYEKESASDFALWKAYTDDDGSVFWDTELGKGRPGWHIECSAMSMKYLGSHFDIHTGGVDNMFPHHENEIAQSEAATGEKFVNYWLHSEHLLVDNKKMSKSLGNFFTLRDIMEKGYKGREVRYLLMSTHYRQKLNFTFSGLDSARNTLRRIDDFMIKLNSIIQEEKRSGSTPDLVLKPLMLKAKAGFKSEMDDDLNISNALASIFDFMRDINKLDLSSEDAKEVLDVMIEFNKVLGVIELNQESLGQEIESLIKEREEARKQKDFKRSDEIRDMLKAKGIVLEDSKDGKVTWKRA